MTTPYQMRFNYLHFAKDYLEHEYRSQLERITLSYPDLNDPLMKEELNNLKYPSREEIFALADQIKEFTDRK